MTQGLLSRQRGLSFISLVLLVAVIVSVGVMVARVVPSLLEYQSVKRSVEKARAGVSPSEIRSLFDRAAQVDDISSIAGKDLDIVRSGTDDRWTVRFAYSREFHVFGPAYLTLKYSGEAR